MRSFSRERWRQGKFSRQSPPRSRNLDCNPPMGNWRVTSQAGQTRRTLSTPTIRPRRNLRQCATRQTKSQPIRWHPRLTPGGCDEGLTSLGHPSLPERRQACGGLVMLMVGASSRPALHPSHRRTKGSLRTYQSPEKLCNTAPERGNSSSRFRSVAHGRQRDKGMVPTSLNGATCHPRGKRG